MPVINFKVSKLSAEKKDIDAKEIENVDVSSNFTILTVGKKKDKELGDYLKVNFSFYVEYRPDLGGIKMDGFLWYREKDLDKIAVEKEGRVEIKPEALEEISTAILRECLLEAVDLAKKLRLPVPLKLPKVTVKAKKEISYPKEAAGNN